MDPVHRFEIRVPSEVVDQNRHVNNVAYVQWMQEAAMEHSAATGCTRMTEDAGASWVARMHRIEYLAPAFAGDLLTVRTWVASLGKVRSLRRYQIIRAADRKVIARGETEWVFVDAATGRPRGIPPSIAALFEVMSGEPPDSRTGASPVQEASKGPALEDRRDACPTPPSAHPAR